MSYYSLSVKLDPEAAERLESIRDYLEYTLNGKFTLDEVCSKIITTVEVRGFVD